MLKNVLIVNIVLKKDKEKKKSYQHIMMIL
jgi:hypothetical protein